MQVQEMATNVNVYKPKVYNYIILECFVSIKPSQNKIVYIHVYIYYIDLKGSTFLLIWLIQRFSPASIVHQDSYMSIIDLHAISIYNYIPYSTEITPTSEITPTPNF